MAYVVGTQVHPSDSAAMRENVSTLVRPKLGAAGASYVAAHETLVGGIPGEWAIGSRWDSLDTGLAALAAFYQDPDVVAALDAAPAEVVGRAIGTVEGEQGDNSGAYAFAIASTLATPDPSRIADLVGDMHAHISDHGCNGVRLIRLVAAGEATGAWITVMYTDSMDSAFDAIAATYSNDAMMDHFQALGIQITGRTISASH